MKKVSGQFKEYSLKKKARTDADGDVYLILGGESEGLCAKLLKDHSKAKQSDVEAALQGSGFGMLADIPIDIAFSRGRFAGYIFQDTTAWQTEPAGASTHGSTIPGRSSGSGYVDTSMGISGMGGTMGMGSGGGRASAPSGSPIIRWSALAVGLVLISLLNMKVFQNLFLGIVYSSFSEDVFGGCRMLSFSGMTALVGGLVLAILLGAKLKEADMVPFLVAVLLGFLAGILLTDVLIVVLVQLVMGVVGLLTAILPILIGIVIVIVVIKSIFKK